MPKQNGSGPPKNSKGPKDGRGRGKGNYSNQNNGEHSAYFPQPAAHKRKSTAGAARTHRPLI